MSFNRKTSQDSLYSKDQKLEEEMNKGTLTIKVMA